MRERTGKGRNATGPSAPQESLRESERQYRLLLDTVQEGIWAADIEGVTTYVNPLISELLDYPVEELVGRSIFDFVDASGLDAARTHYRRALDNPKDHFELMLSRKDGTRAWVELSSSPLPDRSGKATGLIAAVADISARKLAEDAQRLLVDTSIQGFAILQEGRVAFSNEALASISGYSYDELILRVVEEARARYGTAVS